MNEQFPHRLEIDKETEVRKKMLSFELEYCARLFENKIPFPEGVDPLSTFEDIINSFSDISAEIHDAYRKRTGVVPVGDDIEYKKIDHKIISKLEETYKKSPEIWSSNATKIIEDVINELPIGSAVSMEDEQREVLRVGLLRYEVRSGFYDLEEYGIKKEDEYILIHLDAIYKQEIGEENKEVNMFSSDSFQKLAREIRDKYPNTKGVIAESWLIDSPIGKRIGFQVFNSKFEHFYHGDAFWGQFYDQNGQLNQDRINKLLETGKAPFAVKGGFISKDAFLDKYLSH